MAILLISLLQCNIALGRFVHVHTEELHVYPLNTAILLVRIDQVQYKHVYTPHDSFANGSNLVLCRFSYHYVFIHTHTQLVLAKTQEKAASSLTEVTWLGRKLPVRNERLRVSLVKLQQLEREVGVGNEGTGEKVEVYERLLMECQDAMQIVRDELTAEMVSQL